jgi:hypothetical protein
MKKRLIEHPVKTYARQMLREGEIENAEAALAAKDQVDRLQDMVEELGKMNNDELPKLVDKIRASFGSEQSTAYQQAASAVLSELLSTVTASKTTLEQAVLVLTGDAQAVPGDKTQLALPDGSEGGDDLSGEFGSEGGPEANAAPPAPLGRAPRLPAEESRKFNKKLNDAKIIALKEALDNTDAKKYPLRARRLAEELNLVATKAIKEEAKAINVKKNSKEFLKKVAPKKKVNENYTERLRKVYSGFKEWEQYDDVYKLAERLGFDSAEEAWDRNPLVTGSSDPRDFKVVPEHKMKYGSAQQLKGHIARRKEKEASLPLQDKQKITKPASKGDWNAPKREQDRKAALKVGDPSKSKSGIVKKEFKKAGVPVGKDAGVKKSKPEDLKGLPFKKK